MMKEYIIVGANGAHYKRDARSKRDAEAGFKNEYRVPVVAVFEAGNPDYYEFFKQEMTGREQMHVQSE